MREHEQHSSPTVVQVKPEIAAKAHINAAGYAELYHQSIHNPEAFWAEQAQTLHWFKLWDKVFEGGYDGDVHFQWFVGGKLNISVNCIDRHLPHKKDVPAIIWEGDDASEQRTLTYGQLHGEVCRFANGLRALGVKKGDRVTIYMPMVPEAAIAMLACTRIGAVHSVVFGGFAPHAIRDRLDDCGSSIVITANEGLRGGRKVPLKANVDEALKGYELIRHVVVLKRTDAQTEWQDGRDIWWHDFVDGQEDVCEPEIMDAEDPLFILYTSGSTGKPKGVLHTTAGYLLYVSLTHKYVFDYQDGEVYWCTADVGWITGHSYIVYGPLANGASTLMFEGIPSYPNSSRFWEVIDRHKVNIFYTAPTAIRALMREGEAPVKAASRKSLRILGSVGEPINPEAWLWFYNTVGEGRCPVVDTWWQTENGGIMIAPLPGAMALKPGSATLPFFGIEPVITDSAGNILTGECEGLLCIRRPWPGQMRSLYNNHPRFVETYFATVKGMYFSGDGCRRDKDGYYWITGRVDDVLNISGHRMGTAEIESALVAHPKVAEAAVVGFPHDIKGQGIYAYVILNQGEGESDELVRSIVQGVRQQIGPIATPDIIHITPALPKTRSGKIMRRILRKIAENELANLGDITTLSEPEVVQYLIETRKNRGK